MADVVEQPRVSEDVDTALAITTTLLELREVAQVAHAASFDVPMDTDVDAALEQILSAVDRMSSMLAPSGSTLGELTEAQLNRLVCALVDANGRLEGLSALVSERWDESKAWKKDGSRKPSGRLARDTHRCGRDARRTLKRGHALVQMPATSEALLRGRIGVAVADLLITTRGRAKKRSSGLATFRNDEEMLVGICARLTYEDAVVALDYWMFLLDEDLDEAEHEQRRSSRRFGTSTGSDQMTNLFGKLDAASAEVFTNELDRLSMKMLHLDRASGSSRTPAQRRADALVMMATRSRTLAENPAQRRIRPAPLLSIVVGHESFARICELASGKRIAPGLVVPLLSEAQIETFVYGGRKRLIAASHKRFYTGALRRAIEIRDRHCTHPSGCDISAEWCDIDHIVPHADDGPTVFENGRVRCATHNRRPGPSY
jgi:hypothetical protein